MTVRLTPSDTSASKPEVIFVLGGPGAGKGTQCQLIREKFNYNHISAGDCLREERQRPGSKYGEMIETHIREGTIVPVEITCALLRQKMEELGWEGGKFLIDGFPRNENNLIGWNKACEVSEQPRNCYRSWKADVDVRLCLVFECPENVMEERLLLRGQSSGRSG